MLLQAADAGESARIRAVRIGRKPHVALYHSLPRRRHHRAAAACHWPSKQPTPPVMFTVQSLVGGARAKVGENVGAKVGESEARAVETAESAKRSSERAIVFCWNYCSIRWSAAALGACWLSCLTVSPEGTFQNVSPPVFSVTRPCSPYVIFLSYIKSRSYYYLICS
jgi:hypothetical protein